MSFPPDNRPALDALLPLVERPARYIGGEWNSVVKDPDSARLRVCLAFPDLYELGLGNLGLQILYALLNGQESVWAERCYLPGPDMAARMREGGLPLFMLESKDPVAQADALGFTLQSELTYVNLLLMLELAGLPLVAADRDASMPLVFAGGPGAYNPAPLAPFLDFFVIGDGEDVITEIATCLLRHKDGPRRTALEALAGIEGVYVPAVHPSGEAADRTIRARFAASLDAAPYPEKSIVPHMQLVHSGVGLEVLRGCTHGCRFCQAGMVTRPVRERSVDTILALLGRTLEHSGLDDATLLSLSTCDHSRIRTLLRQAAAHVHPQHVAVALPSLRLDRFSVELADYITPMRRSGLTFAPEAGTERLRAVINKPVADDQLVALAEEAFRRGWRHIKTYFMVGLPTEEDADVDAIAALCVRVLEAGRAVQRGVMVRTGVSTFVPKPFTPFQWARQIGLEETRDKQRRLAELLRPYPGIKFGRHKPEVSYIEGLLSRADQRAAALLTAVLRAGGGYETWDEHLNFDAWRRAIQETGYDADAQLAERPTTARLPWAAIDAQVSHTALLCEWQRAQAGSPTPDCRDEDCHHCGALRRAGDACSRMRQTVREGRREDAALVLAPVAPPAVPDGIQRLRFHVGRQGMARFLSHLETVQAWVRALRRAQAPLAYSHGFHAHPRISFAGALPVGEESIAEIMDVILHTRCEPQALLHRLQASLPEGLAVYEGDEVDLRATAPNAALYGLEYDLTCAALAAEEARARLDALLAQREWFVNRSVKHKGGRKLVRMNIRPMTPRLDMILKQEGTVVLQFSTRKQDGRMAKPKEIIELLAIDPIHVRVCKTNTLLA